MVDTFRLYTLQNKGRVFSSNDAANLLSTVPWPAAGDPCLTTVNLSASPQCNATRQAIVTQIATAAGCVQYRSQACAYIWRALSGLAYYNSTSALYVGKNLVPTPTFNPQQSLQDALNLAPLVFHNAYQATVDGGTVVYATLLYSYVLVALGINIVLHGIDAIYPSGETHLRFKQVARAAANVVPFLVSCITAWRNTGMYQPILVITLPAAFMLIWYEWFLPDARRPFMQPFAYALAFTSATLLALVENGVLNQRLIIVELLKAVGAAQLYMGVAWYYIGRSEKERDAAEGYSPDMLNPDHRPGADTVRRGFTAKPRLQTYETQEAGYAVVMSKLVIVLVPIFALLAPYDYQLNSSLLFFTPLFLALLTVSSVIDIQSLFLDDIEGLDKPMWDTYHTAFAHKAWKALSGTTLAFSALTLFFAAAVLMQMYWTFLYVFQALTGGWTLPSLQYDPAQSTLFGIGLPPS
jgi:hypothetical protein